MMVATFATIILDEGNPPVFKSLCKAHEAVKCLRTDKDGVVSFEYVIVTACIIGAVAAAFGTGAGGGIGAALTTGVTAIANAITAAV
jgi:pilus assembly protein Flp/PilA